MMESELRKAGLYPTLKEPAVDVERFIGHHLRVKLDQHADLDASVLGLTEFYAGAPPKISINRDLTNAIDDDESQPGLLGRWRATLAHEASHVLMHRILFELPPGQQNLFGVEEPTAGGQLMRCLKSNVLFRGGSRDSREIQANMGMAALLMPARFFVALVSETVQEIGIETTTLVAGSPAAAELATVLRDRCRVSKQAALIRLETTCVLSPPNQPRFSTAT